MSYCVYKHTCPNDKVYIGITNQNPLRRWNSGRGYQNQKLFHRAILKYGWDNIRHEILLDDLTKEEAYQKEIELIGQYKSNQKEFGYNVSSGGQGSNNVSPSAETRMKISIALKGKNTWQKGRKASEETKQKMSASHIGHYGWTKGKPLTKEHREKVAKGLSKKVWQFSLQGEFIKEWESGILVERTLKISSGHISRSCRGQRKTAGGFIWRYANDCKDKWVS